MQIVFDFANQRIEIVGEGSELNELFTLVREVAPKLPSITVMAKPPSAGRADVPLNHGNGGGGGNGTGAAENRNAPPAPTMRDFVRSIQVESASERIAAIAHYQLAYCQRTTFSPKEMGEWFVQCGFEKPAQMPVAVHSAKTRFGYVENAGHGLWKLGTQGQNLLTRKIEAGRAAKVDE